LFLDEVLRIVDRRALNRCCFRGAEQVGIVPVEAIANPARGAIFACFVVAIACVVFRADHRLFAIHFLRAAHGLLDSTLVIWGGEFGRTPIAQKGGKPGRDHNPHAFTTWMAGGGVKGGVSYGATDEVGFKSVENRVSVHDLHATLLHVMGIDHERLTYRHAGRDYRLTDVYGRVVSEMFG
jgi:hypothetical protein